MKCVHLFALVAALGGALPGMAHALDYKAVGARPAIMYDAPSERGRKIFIAPRGMPVEVVLTYGDWSKVRDVAGDLLWVESRALTPKRTVVARVANTRIRSAADDDAPVAFTADRSVILELVERAGAGWIKVRHRDGQGGFVKATDVWGD
jgi:SH3-like domain-containing protein